MTDNYENQPAVADTDYTSEPVETDTHEEDYVQKYKTLQGKYNAEVPRLQQENLQLQSELAKLKAELAYQASMQNRQSNNTSQTPTELPEAVKYVQKELPEVWEAIDHYFNFKVKNEVLPKIENVYSKIEETTKSSFFTDLSQLYPNWEAIDKDPEFVTWLQQPAPFTNTTKMELLQQAVQSGNARVAASFFRSFEQEKYGNKTNMQKYITPTNSGTPTYNPSGNRQPITKEFIRQFYIDKHKNKYSQEEIKRIERRIDEAISRGEVID